MAEELEETGRHPGLRKAVEDLLPRVFDFSEFLTKRLALTDVGAYYPHRVTYHASCHGLRGLGLGDGPENLLKAVRGIDPGRPAQRRALLRIWRYIRCQERCRIRRHAGGEGARCAEHAR